jgi:hypothetical protein
MESAAGEVAIDHGVRRKLSYTEELIPGEYVRNNTFHRILVRMNAIPNSWKVYLYDIEVYIRGFYIPDRKLNVTYHVVYPMEDGFGEFRVEAWLDTANDGRFELQKTHNISEPVAIHSSINRHAYVYYSVHSILGRYDSTKYVDRHNSFITVFWDIHSISGPHLELVPGPHGDPADKNTTIFQRYMFRINRRKLENHGVTEVKALVLSFLDMELLKRGFSVAFRGVKKLPDKEEYHTIRPGNWTNNLCVYPSIVGELQACVATGGDIFLFLLLEYQILQELVGFVGNMTLEINEVVDYYPFEGNFLFSDDHTHWE